MNKHYGSTLDSFLAEEGILGDVEAVATKRVLAFQLEQAMKEQGISKTTLAQRMETSRAAVNRLLDPNNPSVRLQTLERAAAVLGKKLRLEFRPPTSSQDRIAHNFGDPRVAPPCAQGGVRQASACTKLVRGRPCRGVVFGCGSSSDPPQATRRKAHKTLATIAQHPPARRGV